MLRGSCCFNRFPSRLARLPLHSLILLISIVYMWSMPTMDPAKRKLANRKYYEANKARIMARSREYAVKTRTVIREWLLAYLREHPCVDCGETNPIVLEFDHRGEQTKHFNIGDVGNKGISLRRVKLEVAKCDVRCANCHRHKTYMEAGHSHKG